MLLFVSHHPENTMNIRSTFAYQGLITPLEWPDHHHDNNSDQHEYRYFVKPAVEHVAVGVFIIPKLFHQVEASVVINNQHDDQAYLDVKPARIEKVVGVDTEQCNTQQNSGNH